MGLSESSVWAEPVSQGRVSKVNKKCEHDEEYVAQKNQNYPSEEATIWHAQHGGQRRQGPLDWFFQGNSSNSVRGWLNWNAAVTAV